MLHSCVSVSPIHYLACGCSGLCTSETSLESLHCPCGITQVSSCSLNLNICFVTHRHLCRECDMHTASGQEATDGVKVAALGSSRPAESSGNDRRHISPRLLSLVEPPEWVQGLRNVTGVSSSVESEIILNVHFTNVIPVSQYDIITTFGRMILHLDWYVCTIKQSNWMQMMRIVFYFFCWGLQINVRQWSLLLSKSLWGSFQSFSFFHHQLCGRPLDALRCFLGCPGPALHSHFLHCSLYLCLPIDLLCSHMLECQLENPSCPSARWAPQHVAKSGLVLGELLRLNPPSVSVTCCQLPFRSWARSWYHNCYQLFYAVGWSNK